MDDLVPELRMGSNNRWTNASLRARYRYRISHMGEGERTTFAYIVLQQMAVDGNWTRSQMKAVAEGFELGMKEGL